MSKLQGKTAVVTGAASGIGLASARRFAEEGAQVILADVKPLDEIQRVAAAIGVDCHAIHADVSSMEDLDRIVDLARSLWPRLDIYFANAGVNVNQPLETVTEEAFDLQMNVNVRGMVFGVQKALPLMERGASIILMSSCMADMGADGYTAYGATKAAVRSLARNWALELAEREIRVNALMPGAVFTSAFEELSTASDSKDTFDKLIPMIPMARISSPDELARAALFLACDDSSYMTGAGLSIDGGIGQV
ncbi:hypothetical protein A3711_15855 [Erythrobacter sp. HI00D59]|nr:hypothetical protein A3711_15855 [Erythrobacter sp. HI00D59]